MIALALTSGLFLFTAVTLLWLLSLFLKDASIVDVFWGLGFVGVYWFGFAQSSWRGDLLQIPNTRQLLLGFLLTIWGTRLSLHILARNWGKGEDFRYARWRQEAGQAWWWRSYFKVFLLQGFILWLVAWPLFAVLANNQQPPLGWMDLLAAIVWVTGLLFEAGGDWQLRRFKQNPAHKDQLLTKGLWRYTRHPNYFGDAVVWWGHYLFAAAAGAWWTIFSPLLMTFLLRRVSGVAMLERSLQKTKPGYLTYMAQTNAFFPWWPKNKDKIDENELTWRKTV